MSDFDTHDFDSAADHTPDRPGQLSANGQWMFGALFAGLTLIGFAFGVWAGTSRPKPLEVAKENTEKPNPSTVVQPQPQPQPKVKEPEPKVKEPEPEHKKEPEPKPKEPEPKVKEPEPKKKDPEPKKVDVKPVAFKEVRPILMSYCGNCHGNAGKPKEGIDLRTVATIKKGGDNGDIITVGDPMKSKLYTSMLPGASTAMPPDGKPGPNPKELQLIHDWILSGAKERRRPIRGRNGVRVKTRREFRLTRKA
jgi:hypothetical protein